MQPGKITPVITALPPTRLRRHDVRAPPPNRGLLVVAPVAPGGVSITPSTARIRFTQPKRQPIERGHEVDLVLEIGPDALAREIKAHDRRVRLVLGHTKVRLIEAARVDHARIVGAARRGR